MLGGLGRLLGIDDVFIASYVTVTMLLVAEQARHPAQPGDPMAAVRPWVLFFGVMAGVLDLIENHHILSLLHLAQQGVMPDAGQMVGREVFRAVKWMLGHLVFMRVGLAALPRDQLVWRRARIGMVYVPLPVGAAALV